jgi:hypothetical protein
VYAENQIGNGAAPAASAHRGWPNANSPAPMLFYCIAPSAPPYRSEILSLTWARSCVRSAFPGS